MAFWSSLNGERIISGIITIPYNGLWSAEVILALSTNISTNCTLIIGDLTLDGYAIRMASFAGSRSVRIVGGFGGWRKNLTARQYKYSGIIKLSTILTHAAIEVGEQIYIDPIKDIVIVNNETYIRQKAPAQRLLNELYPNWWISPDGITQIADRSNLLITTPFTVIGYSGSTGKVQIATENISDFLPGRTYTSATISTPQTISSTTINIEPKTGVVRLEILNV